MFLVIKVWNCPAHIQGYLRRFLSEPTSNIFVGTCSKRVANDIWHRIITADIPPRAFKIKTSAENEQGFVFDSHNLKDDFYLEKNEEIYIFGKTSP